MDCEESVVHVPSLQRVAARHGLTVCDFVDMSNFIAGSCTDNDYKKMLLTVYGSGRPLSVQEWEVVSLYAVLVLRRDR
jgi:hypothetical protein